MSTEDKNEIFGHPPGLFLLFFTEMWERFSYYGMRALLVLFLVSQVADGGWAWSRQDSLNLYALYTGLVYLTPILGGLIADKLLGYRMAVVLGALLMTLGHASMALETAATFYTGLGLLIVGNGLFKPNISSIVGQLYTDRQEKKDGAYTIFYMGINSGAFLGILLCGYTGEKVGWSYGFGLAGIFMGLGMIMFYLGAKLFGEIGKRANAASKIAQQAAEDTPTNVVTDRLIVIGILSFFTIFFWMAFEQAGGSMTIFAKDYTARILSGGYATAFFWSNTALTVIPLAIVTFVLAKLIRATFHRIPGSNISIAISFVIVWGIALWMLNKEFNMKAYVVSFDVPVAAENAADGAAPAMKTVERTIQWDMPLEAEQTIYLLDREAKGGDGKLKVITAEEADKFDGELIGKVLREKQNETEVPASWFGILNSFFIITFAPLLSRIWESPLNPSAPVKFGLGLVLLGLGFGVLALGSMGIEREAKTASISMWWLIFAYLLHTLGELCVSPVGLSYVSKLAPAKLVGLMFGIWFIATAVANYLAGWTGGYIDPISEKYGLTVFFLIYTLIPILSGLIIWGLTPKIKKMMHGID
ncbi:Dipeptide permease D [Pirellula sp. SH-Sr6A]|uniref:peptide MFS transporter n=1 Tax=Pirellula sp. SH-Sr6A TaxID=1632865 RepID=UPI00078B3DB6|nr:peptide MFS transporter [Pirellula sp. SH-Sr6A]AMV30926.1 Dipeptide permease D [Pirellula sp. SH-Sr6A]